MKRISKTSVRPSSQKSIMSGKMVMGLMVASVSVLVASSSAASAMPGKWHGHDHRNNRGHSDARGQLARNMGHGYGGANVSVNLGNIVGDNNVIIIVINYFIGR